MGESVGMWWPAATLVIATSTSTPSAPCVAVMVIATDERMNASSVTPVIRWLWRVSGGRSGMRAVAASGLAAAGSVGLEVAINARLDAAKCLTQAIGG